jgi:hypothetical protein
MVHGTFMPRHPEPVSRSRSRSIAAHLLAQYPINACPSDPQPDANFGWPDAIGRRSGYLSSLSSCSRHTALVASFALGFGDALSLALQHGFPLGLPDSGDHAQHETAGAGGGIEGLTAGHPQDPKRYLFILQPGDDPQQVAHRPGSQPRWFTGGLDRGHVLA